MISAPLAFRQLKPALLMTVLYTVLLGGVYPLVVTLFAQTAFPLSSQGSLITQGNKTLGSSLIGRNFTSPQYFWGRPSATNYNAAGSGASNMSPFSTAYKKAVEERISTLRRADPGNKKPVPIELVTASASGVDPHISPDAAEYQLGRVARARGMREEAVRALLEKHTAAPQFGIFGKARVNVLTLNLALDAAK